MSKISVSSAVQLAYRAAQAWGFPDPPGKVLNTGTADYVYTDETSDLKRKWSSYPNVGIYKHVASDSTSGLAINLKYSTGGVAKFNYHVPYQKRPDPPKPKPKPSPKLATRGTETVARATSALRTSVAEGATAEQGATKAKAAKKSAKARATATKSASKKAPKRASTAKKSAPSRAPAAKAAKPAKKRAAPARAGAAKGKRPATSAARAPSRRKGKPAS